MGQGAGDDMTCGSRSQMYQRLIGAGTGGAAGPPAGTAGKWRRADRWLPTVCRGSIEDPHEHVEIGQVGGGAVQLVEDDTVVAEQYAAGVGCSKMRNSQ